MENRKARFDYEILEDYVAGIVLTGAEVKAIRDNKAAFTDSYCIIHEGELFVKKLHISIKDGKDEDKTRDRKALLTRKEINKLHKKIKEKGLTLVPLSLFFNETGLIKLRIGLAKGKKNYDKKQAIKEKDLKKQHE
jgi:SsrA-binding protein